MGCVRGVTRQPRARCMEGLGAALSGDTGTARFCKFFLMSSMECEWEGTGLQEGDKIKGYYVSLGDRG